MHQHDHTQRSIRHLGTALGITLVFFLIELVGGYVTNSLALLTDSIHMLNDSFALVFALIAAWLAQRPITSRRTYGYYRAEVLAGLLNGILLWLVVVYIFYEAFQRLVQPGEVKSLEMLGISFLGLLANGFSAFTLSKSKEENLNVRGVFLHVLADTLGSLGAISAGLIMYFTGWYQADSLISMLIGVLILISSGRLVKESLNVLFEGVPSHIDIDALQQRMTGLEGVKRIHDLHVWCITPMKCVMSCHVIVKKGTDRRRLLETLINTSEEEFGIHHTTIQFEEEDYPKAEDEH